MGRLLGVVITLGGLLLAAPSGCRRSAPIHVWHPPLADVSANASLAIAPIAGDPQLTQALQQALLAQRPHLHAEVALFTPEQLLESSAVRLVSTAPLTNDVLSLAAARNVQADLLLHGEVLDAHIDLAAADPANQTSQQDQKVDWNQAYFHKPTDKDQKHKQILMSWRVIDVSTGKTIGTSSFNLGTADAIKSYPDLDFVEHDQTQLLIAASAREAWKTVAPYVTKDQVRLAIPWLQPGSFTVRRGARAAQAGNWQLAEQRWQWTAKWFPFNSAAQHNLALAYAAREDYPAAKSRLNKATGPLSLRLPPETLLWLDQQHRYHNLALGQGTPSEGWSFPTPDPTDHLEAAIRPVTVVDVNTLPWWTALPLTKPPGWTWQGWLTQPWAL